MGALVSEVQEPSSRPLVSVIVPTWNRARYLPTCLDRLLEQTLDAGAYEIVIADDGSTDETAHVVERYVTRNQPPVVRYALGIHGGINAARNTGIGAAHGSLLTFIDDDELAPPEHLERIVSCLSARDDIEGIGGPYREYGEPRVRTCDHCSLGAAGTPAPRGGEVRRDLLGGNMTIRRRALERVGLFDEDLSGRTDELEWFRRANLRFLFDPDLFIWHRRDQMSLLELCRSQYRQGRSLTRFAAKAGTRRPPRVATILRSVRHGLVRRCGRGYVLAAREMGAASEWLRLRGKRGSTDGM